MVGPPRGSLQSGNIGRRPGAPGEASPVGRRRVGCWRGVWGRPRRKSPSTTVCDNRTPNAARLGVTCSRPRHPLKRSRERIGHPTPRGSFLPPVAFVRSRCSPNFLQLGDSETHTYAGSMHGCVHRLGQQRSVQRPSTSQQGARLSATSATHQRTARSAGRQIGKGKEGQAEKAELIFVFSVVPARGRFIKKTHVWTIKETAVRGLASHLQ